MGITGCTILHLVCFHSETEDNWKWFLENLHSVIGDPSELVICSDACKGLEKAVGVVFLQAENR